jgi:hypothetical protein
VLEQFRQLVRNAKYRRELKRRGKRQKQLDEIVKVSVARVLAAVADRQPLVRKHFFYGASAIHPRHLVTWYIFEADWDLDTAKQNRLTDELDALTRKQLVASGYPVEGAHVMQVAFTSEEDVRNKADGNYYNYFK